MKTPRWATLAFSGCCLIAAGCAALDPQPENTRFFTLSGSTGTAFRSNDATTQIQIRLNRISEYLETTHMVVRVSPNELRYAENNRWAEALEDSFVRVTAHTLSESVPETVSVRVVPIRTVDENIITIDINLLACEAEMPASAVLEADWQVWEGTGTSPSSSGRFRQTRDGWDASNYGQLAKILGELTREFGEKLSEAVQPAVERAGDPEQSR